MKQDTMCYGAKMPDDIGYFAVAIDKDKPEYRKSMAKDISKWIRMGAIVERIPWAQAKESFIKYCESRES
jgi:hypothetical protein